MCLNYIDWLIDTVKENKAAAYYVNRKENINNV